MDETNQDIKIKAFKVIIVGPQAVGKSSLLFRLSESKFQNAYLSTVGIDFKTYSVVVAEKTYSLQIWDTAGQQKFKSLTSSYFKGSSGCICVFDLSDEASIDRCEYYLNKASEQSIPKDCVYLIGNKLDLNHNNNDKGKKLAEQYQIHYVQCSAKDGTGVKDTFDELGKNLVKHFGQAIAQDNSSAKPKVNVKEGRQGCCKG